MRYSFLFACFLLCHIGQLQAQYYLTGIGTKWSDSFVEWEIFFADESDDSEYRGELKMKWPQQEDWTEWSYDWADQWGEIRLVWKNDPSRWQISGGGENVTARRMWKEDDREWRVTDNSISLTFKTKWGNNRTQWLVRETTYGTFRILMNYGDDPREWIIYDNFDERVSPTLRMALVFLAIYNSSPRF